MSSALPSVWNNVALFRRRGLVGLALAAVLLCLPASAATSDWFLGGSYDGYDLASAQAPVGWLAVNNAGGASNVTPAEAWLNGALAVTSNGASATVRVYWGAADGGINREAWSHTNDFGSVLEGSMLTTNVGVNSNTVYYYRFYATNETGQGWAPESASFTTPGLPVLVCAPPVVGDTSATLQGNLMAGVSAEVTVFWGEDTNAWANTNSLGTLGQGAFDTLADNLSQGTLYYYQCYGSNDYGEGRSEVVPFTSHVEVAGSFIGGSYDGYDLTSAQAPFGWLAVNNAGGASNVTPAEAWLNGALAVTSNGASATVRVYWGAADGGINREAWSHTNDFGSVLEGSMLTTNVGVNSNTVYYYRFYATNETGQGWAPESASFTTPGLPVLVCAPPVVGDTSATLQGNLMAGVSAEVTVFWGEDTNAWANTNSLGTLGQGAFDTLADNLSQGTLYYYQCYGSNDYGEGRSEVVPFKTHVEVAGSFIGGSYDGYDQFCGRLLMQSYKGSVFSIR